MRLSHLFRNLLALAVMSAPIWTAHAADMDEDQYQALVRQQHRVVRLSEAELVAGIGTRFEYIGHFHTRRPGLTDRDSLGGRHRFVANSVVFNVKTGTRVLLSSVNIYCDHHVLCGHGDNGRLTAGQPLRLFLTAGAGEVDRVEIESMPEQANTEVVAYLEQAPAGVAVAEDRAYVSGAADVTVDVERRGWHERHHHWRHHRDYYEPGPNVGVDVETHRHGHVGVGVDTGAGVGVDVNTHRHGGVGVGVDSRHGGVGVDVR